MNNSQQHVSNALNDAREALEALTGNTQTLTSICESANAITDALKLGHQVFSCGNGGSMCDAIHFAEELSGRFREDRTGLPATAISDPGHLSCVANDYGYEYVFSRYLQAHARRGDVLIAISTSGKSANVIKAAEHAKREQMTVISLTGRSGSALSEISDIDICTPAGKYADRVQELHIKVLHIIVELIERNLFPDNYETQPTVAGKVGI